MSGMISKYMAEIEDLRTKLCQSENMCEQLRKENTKVSQFLDKGVQWVSG